MLQQITVREILKAKIWIEWIYKLNKKKYQWREHLRIRNIKIFIQYVFQDLDYNPFEVFI